MCGLEPKFKKSRTRKFSEEPIAHQEYPAEDNKVTRDETSNWLSSHVSANWGERK